MTGKELATWIGQTVAVKEKGFAWFATVNDAKDAWGTLRLEVTPQAGIGTGWVDSLRVEIL